MPYCNSEHRKMRVLAWPALGSKSSNPYNRLLYKNVQELGPEVEEYSFSKACTNCYDIFHIHWPDYQLSKKSVIVTLFRLAYLFLLLAVVKMKKAKIVWTVHNLSSHEKYHPFLEKAFWKIFLSSINGYVCLTASGRQAALERFPALGRLPGAVIQHGHYRGIYPNTFNRITARDELGLPRDAKVLLFFGAVRPYKNVCHLISTYREVADPHTRLVVAGKPSDGELAAEVAALAQGDPRISLHLSFIPDSEIDLFMNAADLVVLPFTDILNSGSSLLSLSYDRPILVPSKGAMEELRKLVGSDWVFTYRGALTPGVLVGALHDAVKKSGPSADLSKLDWVEISAGTVAFYEELLLAV